MFQDWPRARNLLGNYKQIQEIAKSFWVEERKEPGSKKAAEWGRKYQEACFQLIEAQDSFGRMLKRLDQLDDWRNSLEYPDFPNFEIFATLDGFPNGNKWGHYSDRSDHEVFILKRMGNKEYRLYEGTDLKNKYYQLWLAIHSDKRGHNPEGRDYVCTSTLRINKLVRGEDEDEDDDDDDDDDEDDDEDADVDADDDDDADDDGDDEDEDADEDEITPFCKNGQGRENIDEEEEEEEGEGEGEGEEEQVDIMDMDDAQDKNNKD